MCTTDVIRFFDGFHLQALVYGRCGGFTTGGYFVGGMVLHNQISIDSCCTDKIDERLDG